LNWLPELTELTQVNDIFAGVDEQAELPVDAEVALVVVVNGEALLLLVTL